MADALADRPPARRDRARHRAEDGERRRRAATSCSARRSCRKDDRSLVLAETNNEIENPLWHGEVHCLKRFYEMPKAERADTKDCIFLATHEPCSLCLSAITWTGFDNFYYLFSHEDSRDSFAIPHDLKILKEVFTPRSRRLQCRERLLEELFDRAGWCANCRRPSATGWKRASARISRALRRAVRRPTRRARPKTTFR